MPALFDFTVFARWPRGLFLSQKLSESGYKTAYVEILPRLKNPFGLFLNENSEIEKHFLESLGFLQRQEGGFCLISPEGVWPLQDMKSMTDRLPVLKNKLNKNAFKNFKNYWFSYLSLNLASKVFEYNNSKFSNKGLNFFSDYFLFEPSFKKIEEFQKNHPNISFFRVEQKDLLFQETEPYFFIQKKAMESKRYVWLGGNSCLTKKNIKTFPPDWTWSNCFFKSDFESYNKILPSHFVSLKNIFLPWSHDNLLSVFHQEGCWEVWMRTPYNRNKEDLIEEAKGHLETVFPGCVFHSINRKSFFGPDVYSQELLSLKRAWNRNIYIENVNDFFQLDLSSEISAEKELFNSL